MRIGIENLLAIDQLPYLRSGVQVHYEGSIDKQGGNADWDWSLYQDERGEWVLLDVDGPGCIYNFVQHRYPTCAVPTFRFYFDGETTPRFEIKPEEFGNKYPFIAPLAGIFEGDDTQPAGRGPIWVVRSFVPMPFVRGCRITSTVKLEGFERSKGHGGWGHVMYHSYVSTDGIKTFTGKEDLSPLLKMWGAVGADPKENHGNDKVNGTQSINAGASAIILEQAEAGSLSAIRLKVREYLPSHLHDLWLRITWDHATKPAIECPLGAFFGNEFGLRSMRYLMHGMTVNGTFYSYWPMPFWKSARVEIVNRGAKEVVVDFEIEVAPSGIYDPKKCGYFRASDYYPRTPATPKQDSRIATIHGRGHIVSALLTGWSLKNKYVSCEGDVRVYIDGNRTPQVESDGSESYACYGWGFVAPGQQNPVSGYDGQGHPTYAFTETRLSIGDWYPFEQEVQFGIEAGDRNDCPMAHSGVILYYGRDDTGMIQTDEVITGEEASAKAHDYRVSGKCSGEKVESLFETDDSTAPVMAQVNYLRSSSEFVVAIDPANSGVRLRRMADQLQGRQRARVYVDGIPVTERTWYFADSNPHRRWLEDEFEIPASYTQGKKSILIRLEPIGENAWSEARYAVLSILAQKDDD